MESTDIVTNNYAHSLPASSFPMATTAAVESEVEGVVDFAPYSDMDDNENLHSIPLYTITNKVYVYVTPIIICLGLFGNVMAIVVMRRVMTSSGDHTVSLYIVSIAVADLTLLLLLPVPNWVKGVSGVDVYTTHTACCKVLTWIQTNSGTISCWLVVAITVSRALSVVWPHRIVLLCTTRRVKLLIVVIVVCSTIWYSHPLYGMKLVPKRKGNRTVIICGMDDPAYMAYYRVVMYMEVFIYCILPSLSLVVANSVLVWKLYMSAKKASDKLTTGHDADLSRARHRMTNSVTLTVVVMSLAYLLLTGPGAAYYVMHFFQSKTGGEGEGQETDPHQEAQIHLFHVVSWLLYYTNHSVNFYLYCLTGERFRSEFLNIVTCGRRKPSTPRYESSSTDRMSTNNGSTSLSTRVLQLQNHSSSNQGVPHPQDHSSSNSKTPKDLSSNSGMPPQDRCSLTSGTLLSQGPSSNSGTPPSQDRCTLITGTLGSQGPSSNSGTPPSQEHCSLISGTLGSQGSSSNSGTSSQGHSSSNPRTSLFQGPSCLDVRTIPPPFSSCCENGGRVIVTCPQGQHAAADEDMSDGKRFIITRL